MTDHYAALGVPRTAVAGEIKQAFRRLASQHHPDKGGDTEKFQKIQAAYDVLGDVTKRAAYDNPAPQFSGFNNGHPFDLNNIFNMFAQSNGQFTRGQQRRNHARMTLWISLADAVRGGSKTVAVNTDLGSATVQLDIPPGIDDNDNVQYGAIAPGGLDLVVQFRLTPDPVWRRDGLNLHAEHKTNIWTLITGGDIEIKILGNRTLSFGINPQTQPGTVVRLKSQGVQTRSGDKGDLLIRLQAELPAHIPDQLLDAIRAHKG